MNDRVSVDTRELLELMAAAARVVGLSAKEMWTDRNGAYVASKPAVSDLAKRVSCFVASFRETAATYEVRELLDKMRRKQ